MYSPSEAACSPSVDCLSPSEVADSPSVVCLPPSEIVVGITGRRPGVFLRVLRRCTLGVCRMVVGAVGVTDVGSR